MSPYDPNSEISFLALSKLQESSANIRVLSALECNIEKFKDTAGYNLIKLHDFSITNMKVAHENIESWKAEKTPNLMPIWSAFLEVLREIGLGHLAQDIDDFLKKTSPSFEPSDECKKQEDGRPNDHNSNYVVSLIHIKFHSQQWHQ